MPFTLICYRVGTHARALTLMARWPSTSDRNCALPLLLPPALAFAAFSGSSPFAESSLYSLTAPSPKPGHVHYCWTGWGTSLIHLVLPPHLIQHELASSMRKNGQIYDICSGPTRMHD